MINRQQQKIINHFNAISQLPFKWGHNEHYHQFLLKNIPDNKALGLEIGCGTGRFTSQLSSKCNTVIGVDFSPAMIRIADKNNQDSKILFKCISLTDYLKKTNKRFDVIVSIATFHHLDMKSILKTLKERLNSGGTIIILDIFKTNTFLDFVLSVLSAILNPFFYLFKQGRLGVYKKEKQIWKEHLKHDTFLTINEIKKITAAALGKASIKRHLYWRYSLIYKHKSENSYD